MRTEPYVIGLTGNIATGKSTVARMLERLGALVIDADKLAHAAMRQGTPVYTRIMERFGPAILAEDGEINRRALGAIVFAQAEALRDLERIVHPAVIAETRRILQDCSQAVCVIEAVKLLEARMHRHCHSIWVVTCTRAQQIERLMRTRGMTEAEATLRIDAQPPAGAKLAQADVLIDNSSDLNATWQQVMRAWNAIPGNIPVALDTPWIPAEETTP